MGQDMFSLIHKKIAVFYIIFILSCTFITTTISTASEENQLNLIDIDLEQIQDTIQITYHINDYQEETVTINGIEHKIIKIGQESNILQKGQPDIPNICRSIIIPDTTKMKIEIINAEYQEINNIKIAPSKGNLLRSVNPEDVPYEFAESYQEDNYFPGQLAKLREPYILRDFRGQVIELYPIQYNPIQKTMRHYNQITIKITPDGTDNINTLQRENLPQKIDTNYKQIYQKRFINYGMQGRYDPIEEQGNMLIITYDEFRDNMQEYVDWKTLQGIPTEIVNVSTIGDADDIKLFIKEYYFDFDLSFVLLVGDSEQVPTNIIGGGAASDNKYAYIVGDDHYPEVLIGRFSAQNNTQIQTIINRSIKYEKNPKMDVDWFNVSTGIASNDPRIGDDDEYDWQHMRNIRNKLMNYTYFRIDEFYDGSQGGEDESGDPTEEMVINAFNEGRSIINYCGHGNPAKWFTTDFSVSDINDLENDNMLPFVVCVACRNGQFQDYDDSFCEALLRATNDNTGEPTGAIAVTGSSKDMLWAPPMDAQDAFMDLIIGSYEDNEKHTIGGIHFNGLMHMIDEYGYNGETESDAWNLFGDPSLLIRTEKPVEMDVQHDSEIVEGSNKFKVNISGIPRALCSISRNGDLLGSAFTDASGNATVRFDPVHGEFPLLDLVVTAYNKIPYTSQIIVDVNKAPSKPSTPEGPNEAEIDIECTFYSTATDEDGDQISYQFDWGDGTHSIWKEYVDSGETGQASHYFTKRGYFPVRVRARDIFEVEGEWSDAKMVSIENDPPNKPTISGPKNFLKPDIQYVYTFRAWDMELDDVFIKILWEENESEWLGPLKSLESVKYPIIWEEPQTEYELKAVAKDEFGEQGPWTTVSISTPRSYPYLNDMYNDFPNLFQFFRLILKIFS